MSGEKLVVKKTKKFVSGNVEMNLVLHEGFELYFIEFTRKNTGEIFNVHGAFCSLAEAEGVFDKVVL